jgi:hypothetical protein
MRDKIGAAVTPAMWAAAALIVTTLLIAEIAAVPTWDPGISSSSWTPTTSVTALFFGQDAFHGDFAPLSILFGCFVIVLASIAAGLLWAAFITYCLGRSPHPLPAALLGAACGLATEILLINLLLNWLQEENGVYTSLPSWGWWVGMAAWGASLGLGLSRAGQRGRRSASQTGGVVLAGHSPSEGAGVRLAGHSPSAEAHPGSPPLEARR